MYTDQPEEYEEAIEALAEELHPKFMEFLNKVANLLSSDSKPVKWDGDKYVWNLIVSGVEVMIQICEEHDYEKGTPTGINFMIKLFEAADGEIYGGWAPHNYSDECWVDIFDTEEVERRLDLFLNTMTPLSIKDEIEQISHKRKN